MAEREDTGFKVTDRRKYNPDGSPRESAEPETEIVVTEAEAPTPIREAPAPIRESAAPIREAPAPIREAPANHVVLFPGEAAKKQPEPVPQAGAVASEPRAAGPGPTAAQVAAGQAEQAYNQARGPGSARLPEPSFLSLVNMLGVEAAMHLGLIQTQGEEPLPVDTEAARHLLDMLGILQTKTRGNLTAEEDHLFENMLADLRMQFVAVSRRR
jgi:hypothetical protein